MSFSLILYFFRIPAHYSLELKAFRHLVRGAALYFRYVTAADDARTQGK